ncbi:redoxin domain-containing protein, partial [Lentzea sp. NEAU-D13]|nr:redoxin domain-containing protein [Lentzea alba]
MFGIRVMAGSLVLLASLAACGGDPAGAPQPAPTPPPATSQTSAAAPTSGAPEVPDQLKFTAKTVDGKDLNGADLAGKPVVLWFWAPWCPKC